MLDKAIQSLESTFKQLQSLVKVFRFLDNFHGLQKTEIRKHTADLEAALTDTKTSHKTGEEVVTTTCKDVDGYVMAAELEALKTSLPTNVPKPQDLFEYLVVNQ